jgi:hypothetical protein
MEPWTVYRLMMMQRRATRKTGLEALRAGNGPAVIETAKGIIEGNFS